MIHMEIRVNTHRDLVTFTIVESNPPPDRKRWEFEVMTLSDVVLSFGDEFEAKVRAFAMEIVKSVVEDMAKHNGADGLKVESLTVKNMKDGSVQSLRVEAGQKVGGALGAEDASEASEQRGGKDEGKDPMPPQGRSEGTKGICG